MLLVYSIYHLNLMKWEFTWNYLKLLNMSPIVLITSVDK